MLGIGGTSQTYAINDCVLFCDFGDWVLSERMKQVHISVPNVRAENYEAIMSIPSLLGIDFLQRYALKFENMFVHLER